MARRKPEYSYSLMMELVSWEGLKGALAGREEKQLCSVLQFVNRYLADSRFCTMMLHLANLLLIKLYLPALGMRSSVGQLFTDMKRGLDRELQDAFDLDLDEEKTNKVEHRVVQISGLVEQ